MSNSTMLVGEKIEAAKRFLVWLEKKYPVPEVRAKWLYSNRPWLRRAGVTASMWQRGLDVKVEIACDRDVSRVLQSVPHEYKHILQLFREGIPYHKIKTKQEHDAWAFSAMEMRAYFAEVGTDW